MILAKNSELENKSLLINKSSKEVAVSAGKIKISVAKKISKQDLDVIYLDSAKLDFPLRVRSVLSGDYFYPFGMNGKKKVSKYLKDKKISVFDLAKITTPEIKPMTINDYSGPKLTMDMSLETIRWKKYTII